jgi:hypothetical protein
MRYLKARVYRINPHTEEKSKESIQREILELPLEELMVNFNLFKGYGNVFVCRDSAFITSYNMGES